MAWRLPAVAGGGPNRATAIVVARLVFTICGQSRASPHCASSTSSLPPQPPQRACHARIRVAAAGAPRGRTCAGWGRPRSLNSPSPRSGNSELPRPSTAPPSNRISPTTWPPRCPVACWETSFHSALARRSLSADQLWSQADYELVRQLRRRACEAVAAAVMLPMMAADRLAPSASSHTGGAFKRNVRGIV